MSKRIYNALFKRTLFGQAALAAVAMGSFLWVANVYAVTVDKVGTRPVPEGMGPTPACQQNTFDVTAAQAEAVNTYFQAVKVPAGTMVFQGTIRSDDMDESTGLVLDVGYGESTAADDFLDGSTIGQAGGTAPLVGLPLLFAAPDTIDVQIATAAATGAAGQITLELCGMNRYP